MSTFGQEEIVQATTEVSRKTLTLLWNASSGWDEKDEALAAVQKVISSGGRDVTIKQVEKGMDIKEESRAIVRSRPDVLIAAGGDGTLNAVASTLLYQATAFGVIPAGTLNHFARDLQIPFEPREAAKALIDGREVRVDAALANGHPFINNAVLGLFPNYRLIREAWERRGFGSSRLSRGFATLMAAAWVFWKLPRLAVRMEIRGQVRLIRTAFVMVANNEHKMEGLGLGHRSRLDEGLLWVYVLRPCSRWGLLRAVIGLLTNRISRESVFDIYQCSRFRIESKHRRIGVGVDGEFLKMQSPLDFEILPRALRVIVPPGYRAELEGPGS